MPNTISDKYFLGSGKAVSETSFVTINELWELFNEPVDLPLCLLMLIPRNYKSFSYSLIRASIFLHGGHKYSN